MSDTPFYTPKQPYGTCKAGPERQHRYTWFSITESCVNRGNLLIEYALRRVLPLPGPELSIDSFQPMSAQQIDAVNRTGFVIIPGCTTIQPGHNPAMEQLSEIAVPKYVVGGAFSAGRLIGDVRLCRHVTPPIGARDPYTHRSLRWHGIRSVFIGCPTLTLGESAAWTPGNGPVVVSFGRGSGENYRRCTEALAQRWEVVGVVQSPGKGAEGVAVAGVSIVKYPQPEETLALYRSARLIVTNRLHAALPAVAFGIPVIFATDWWDSRFTLIRYLGVRWLKLHSETVAAEAERILDNPDRLPRKPFERAAVLRHRFLDFVSDLRQIVESL